MLRNLLTYRILTFDILLGALVAWAYQNGDIVPPFTGKGARMSIALAAVFLITKANFYVRVVKTSQALNEVKAGRYVDARKFVIKNAFVSAIGAWLVAGGLIGNNIGFLTMATGMHIGGGADEAMAALGAMTDGMVFAFGTTLVGLALGLWLLINGHMLRVATALLKVDADKLKEGRA